MAPTAPFSTNTQVSYLLIGLRPGGQAIVFSETSTPPGTVVDGLRTMKSAALLVAFAEAGYYAPLQDISGETWPAHQTNYLAAIEAIGVAGDIGATLRPAPATGMRRGSAGNVYQQIFQDTITRIRLGSTRFRAAFYAGTRAERALNQPRAPMTEFGEGYYDPARYSMMNELIDILETRRGDLNYDLLDWDHMYTLRSTT